VADAEKTVVKAIKGLLRRKKGVDAEFVLDADLYDDLELDSLEVAELSAVLEDDLGTDPYSEGETPRTVGEVVQFYDR
jgi:acyl carrier protein